MLLNTAEKNQDYAGLCCLTLHEALPLHHIKLNLKNSSGNHYTFFSNPGFKYEEEFLCNDHHGLIRNYTCICDTSREEPPNRLAKMGAMPTPFRGADRAVEDTPPLQAEREEARPETPPGKRVFPEFW